MASLLDAPLHRSLAVLVVGLGALALTPLVASPKMLTLLTEICAMLTLAITWNLLAGFAGIVLMGFQIFIGVGGYVLFLVANGLDVSPFLSVGVSAASAALAGLVIAPIIFRLNGAQLAIGSWVLAEIVRLLVYHTEALGGGGGFTLIAMRSVPRADRLLLTYGTALAVLTVALVSILLLMRSKYGLALRAMRDNGMAAEALGVNIFRTRLGILVLCAALAGAAGATYYLVSLHIGPDAGFSINWTAIIIFIVVLGGIGTLEGPIIGAVVYFSLREILASDGTVYFIVIGTLAIAVTIASPKGLWGVLKRLRVPDLLPIRHPAHKG